MSMGIGAWAHKILEDDSFVVYEYGGYNLNQPEYRNENRVCDGNITIPKNCFVEPEIHQKLRKMPSGRKKLVIKRIPVPVDYRKMLRSGLIETENCSHCWNRSEDLHIDITIYRILYRIFQQYQEDGQIPERVSFHT